MFSRIKSKLRDMGTIRQLCEIAEAHALQDRQQEPGAEHFLLAALDLEDGTARLAFQRTGANPEGLKRAIEHQYEAALHSVGIAVAPAANSDDVAPERSALGPYEAAPSGQEVMQALADSRQRHEPLLGAHIVAIVAAMPHGVAARALRIMGIDAAELRTAAEEVARSRSVT
jgi:ATP-dependent Clp protease ATP-binding subunit ClpA